MGSFTTRMKENAQSTHALSDSNYTQIWDRGWVLVLLHVGEEFDSLLEVVELVQHLLGQGRANLLAAIGNRKKVK